MLRAVSAAALWLLAVGSGLCVPAEASSEQGFTDCSHSFYRHTPPQGSAAGPLRPLCHSGPGGQSFATLYQPNCGSAVYSAFHLSNGLAVSTEDKGAGVVSKEESVKVVVPALLQGNSDGSQLSPAASHLQQWDSTVTTRVQSSFGPQCHTLGGDLYVLIGAGRLKPIGDEDKECQGKLLWSAVCCAVTQGKGFSAAFIKETEGEERQVKVKELQDMLGVTELFSGGCGDVQTKKVLTPQRHSGSILASAAKVPQTEEVHADNRDQMIHEEEVIEETVSSTKAQATSEEQPDDAESTKNDERDSEGSEASEDSEDSEDSISETVAELSEETVEEEETDDNSTSTVLYVLSTTLYILKAPLHPLVSTVAELPGQVMYVLQEDLGVLSALPGETYSFFHLLISDTFSWIGLAADLLLSIGEAIFSRFYFCTSSMGEALWDSCYTGVTGTGTLAGDTLGIFGDVLDNAWWVTKFFGGWLFEQSGEYAGNVVGEMGGQAKAVGGGLGNLAWSGGKGVGNVFKFGEGIVWRLGGKIFGSGKEAERQEESVSLSEKIEEVIEE